MPAAGQLFANNAVALLDANITPTSTSLQVQAGYGALFPAPSAPHEFFLITLESAFAPLAREIVKIESRAGDTLVVAPGGRGWEGTTPAAWSAGDTLVDHRITAGSLRELQGNFGEPTAGLSIPVTVTAQANSLPITGPNKTCKWIITIQTADDRVTMTEVLAVYKAAPETPRFTEYARTGDRVSYTVDVIGTPTEMILEITNDDTALFTSVDIIRIQHYA